MSKLIMCPLVVDATPPAGVDPTQQPCRGCREPIWVARSSRELVVANPDDDWCLACNACATLYLLGSLLADPGPVEITAAPTAAPAWKARVRGFVSPENN